MTQDNSGKKPKQPKRATPEPVGSAALRDLRALMEAGPGAGNKAGNPKAVTTDSPGGSALDALRSLMNSSGDFGGEPTAPMRTATLPSAGLAKLGGRYHIVPPPKRAPSMPVKWRLWLNMREVHLWEATLLSMDIDPKCGRPDPDFEDDGVFKSYAEHEEYKDRLKLLRSNLGDPEYFRPGTLNLGDPELHSVQLSEYAVWASQIRFENLPSELVAIAEHPTSQVTTSPEERRSEVTGDESDEHKEAVAEQREDDELAALFDPVRVATLEAIFPAGGRWKSWVERAKANGLINARVSNGRYNPYRAGRWFLDRGIDGWSQSRINRKLAAELPKRSKDSADLLTGELP